METGTATRLDPRVKRSRQLIQQSFMQLIAEKDFQNITVQDITERAEVNRATFYAHFEDKYALLNHMVREAFHEMLESKLPGAPTLTLANLRLLAIIVCEYLGQFLSHCKPMSRNYDHMQIVAQVQKHVCEVLVEWIRRSPVKAGSGSVSPETTAAILSWVIFGAAFEWANERQKVSIEQLVDQMLPFLSTGLEPYLAENV